MLQCGLYLYEIYYCYTTTPRSSGLESVSHAPLCASQGRPDSYTKPCPNAWVAHSHPAATSKSVMLAKGQAAESRLASSARALAPSAAWVSVEFGFKKRFRCLGLKRKLLNRRSRPTFAESFQAFVSGAHV